MQRTCPRLKKGRAKDLSRTRKRFCKLLVQDWRKDLQKTYLRLEKGPTKAFQCRMHTFVHEWKKEM
jgi:hypothetical protein